MEIAILNPSAIYAALSFCIKIAAFLEPNAYIRLRHHPDELNKSLALLKAEMTRECRRQNQSSIIPQTNNVNAISSTLRTSFTDKNKNSGIEALFSLCGINNSAAVQPASQGVMSVDEEIGYFISSINLASGMDFSSFWTTNEKKLPVMSALVRRIMNIPASSVPCESSFSIAGYIRRKERCALSSEALRFSMVLKDADRLAGLQVKE